MGHLYHLPPYRVEFVTTQLTETIDWGISSLHVPDTWKSTRGKGIKVGICDTGIDGQHKLGGDLSGAILDVGDFTNPRRRDNPPGTDHAGHGTHCAGIVAARHNDIGVIGVAPEASLLIAKVLGNDGSGSGDWIAAGINWCIQSKADIISMSLGSVYPDPVIREAIEAANAAGIFVIMAAGNEGQPNSVNYPAKFQQGVAVAAYQRNGTIAPFSSQGPEVDIAAPGQDILSTYLNGGYAKLSGTSMATPFVAGIVALLLAQHRGPGSDHAITNLASLKAVLSHTATDAGPTGRDPAYGWGLIDPVTILAPPTQPSVPPSPIYKHFPIPKTGLAIYAPARPGDYYSVGDYKSEE